MLLFQLFVRLDAFRQVDRNRADSCVSHRKLSVGAMEANQARRTFAATTGEAHTIPARAQRVNCRGTRPLVRRQDGEISGTAALASPPERYTTNNPCGGEAFASSALAGPPPQVKGPSVQTFANLVPPRARTIVRQISPLLPVLQTLPRQNLRTRIPRGRSTSIDASRPDTILRAAKAPPCAVAMDGSANRDLNAGHCRERARGPD